MLALILLTGFILRVLPLKGQGSEMIFLTPDSYYHLWRVIGLVKNFPALMVFDPYLNFPAGGYCIWPFLFDYLPALALKILGFQPFTHGFETVCFVYPALYGTALVGVVYLLGRELFSPALGLIAAFFYSLLPAALDWGRAGYFDHDIAFTLFTALAFYFYLRTQAGAKGVLPSGVFLALSFLVWPGSILFAFILSLAAIGGWILRGDRRMLACGAGVLGIAALGVFPFALFTSLKIGNALSPDYLSAFYPLCLAIGGGGLIALYLWAERRYPLAAAASLLLGIAAGLTILVRGPQIAAFALAFLFKQDPWLRHIVEFQPLILLRPVPSAAYAEQIYGWGFFALPGIGIAFGLREKVSGPRLAFLIWSLALLGLNLLQRRYTVAFALPFALWLAYATAALSRLPGKWKLPALAVWLVLILHPFLFYDYLPRPAGSLQTADWARDHLAGDPPRFAMLSDWGLGHEVRYFARIPPVADNFGTQSSHLREAAAYFTSSDEDSVRRFFEIHRIRWVWAIFAPPAMEIYQELSGSEKFVVPQGGVRWEKKLFQGLFYEGGYHLSPGYYGLLPSRLYLFDGLSAEGNGRPAEGLQRFRLIYESEQTFVPFDKSMPAEKIFEYVPGARVRIRGAPGAALRLGLQVATNTRRTFVYWRHATLDPRGDVELVLPYSTLGNPYPVRATDRYLVECAGRVWGFDVTEQEVTSGEIVSLDLPPKTLR